MAHPLHGVDLAYIAAPASFCAVNSWGGHAEAGQEETEGDSETHFGMKYIR